ncbi:MAG: NADH:flavin oxidoreductase/NADH oxidase [Acetobacteraceae bacterium]|nr:NADH:flavin oxidoreductase/NADH oxidase [Acetobacteraceae bacterium]MSP30501.1 NADH:flavin oxidoreductase/NADH oxidase [Acetobacteraceae bacterium]
MDTNAVPWRDPSQRPLLFTPISLRGITAPNRCVLAPMVQYRAKDGVPTDFHMVHLGKFALGRFGIVMNEATAVEARGRVSHGCPGIWNDAQMHGWKKVTDYIRREGSVSAMQLAHAGRKASTSRAIDGTHPYSATDAARGLAPWDIIGPTGTPMGPGQNVPAQMTQLDIDTVVRAFAEGAKRSDAAGFDIVEIHGAHGYLIASFLSPISNTRNDQYGGDRAGRMRFPLEITRAVREVWPSHKPLFFRVSSLDGADGWNLVDTVAFALELKALGVSVVDCSSGGLTGSAVTAPIKRYPGFQVPFAEAVHKAGVPSMAVGLILDGKQAEQILREGKADLIAIGRQALYDPFWPVHAAEQLGCDPDFAMWPEEYGWWLEKRSHSLVRG